MQKYIPIFIAGTTSLVAAQNTCAPSSPATCYTSPICDCQYCPGPAKTQGNAPVRPRTCNGDVVINVAGFYWNAHQDGMEYAIQNYVKVSDINSIRSVANLNNLVNAKFHTPDFEWDFGFKVGLGYNTTCDGWDLGVNWTHFRGKASSSIEAEPKDNQMLIALWSASNLVRNTLHNFAFQIDTDWHVNLDLIAFELAR